MRQLCRLGFHARPRLVVRAGPFRVATCPGCGAELTRHTGRWEAARPGAAHPRVTELALPPQPDRMRL